MAGVVNWSFALMNKRPKLGSGESELNVYLWVFDAKERMAHVYDNRWYEQFAMSADVACAFPIRVSKGLADATRE
jgi:hypothetical protein